MRLQREKEEKAELVRQEDLRLQREKEEKAELIRQEAEQARKAELELQRQQFTLQLEQLRKDREDAERRRLEQMIEVEV